MSNITQRQQSSVSNIDSINPYEAFADNAIGLDAQIVKFVRGTWTTGQDNEEIAADAKFLAVVTGLRHGHVRWEDGQPVERRMLLVADYPIAASRIELGDTDENNWARRDGEPVDPWTFTYELPLLDLETEGARIYATSSIGGRSAVGRLARTYGQRQRRHPGTLPVVTLGCESYRHETYGTIQKPSLKVVDWMPDPDWAPPKPPSAADTAARLNDELPFTAEWR